MSLNKRSLRKKARPEPSLEDQLRAHERNLKSRRGSNRRAAFDAIRQHDEPRAVAAVEAILEGTSGRNREELGALLASTNEPRFVDAALRGKYGDVALVDVVSLAVLHEAIERFADAAARLDVKSLERRARALGLVPLHVDAAKSPHIERAFAAIADDARVDGELKKRALASALVCAPALVWRRRDHALVGAALATAAGIASGLGGAVDVDAFARNLAALPSDERVFCLENARLVRVGLRDAPEARARILCLALDEPGVDVATKVDIIKHLTFVAVRDRDRAAVEAILSRPQLAPAATVLACDQVAPEEAHAVLAPLLRQSEAARDAFLSSEHGAEAIFLDDIVALLAIDLGRARAMLQRNEAPRAKEELARLPR